MTSPKDVLRAMYDSGPARRVRGPIEARTGDLRLRVQHRRAAPDSLSVLPALGWLRPRSPRADDDPVLILSAGWRSGSTMVQRAAMSTGEILVWGEPWHRSAVVQRLRASLVPIGDDWPREDAIVATDQEEPWREWVANLFPPPDALVEAHRAMLRTLFAEPARRLGSPRWGAKFVRLDAEDAAYLHFLFPRGRLVFLVRNPYDAWASYRGLGLRAHRYWPDEVVISPAEFGRVWADAARGFHEAADELGAHLVRYEDITGPDASRHWDALAEHLGVTFDPRAISTRVGSSPSREICAAERHALARTVAHAAPLLGY